MAPLSEVIAELNDRFGLGLGTSDEILVYQQIAGLVKDTSMQQIALMNDEERFGQVADDRLDDIVAQNAERNTDFVKNYFDNPDFRAMVKEAARKRAYRIITEPVRDEALAKLRQEMNRETGTVTEPAGELVVYRSDDGRTQVQLRAVQGTVWLTQAQMADLYATSVQNIGQIIRRILDDGEVTQATINSEFIVRQEGSRQVRREVMSYSLDMILAVGYRVTTPRAVQFRQWATTVLREYLVKGFALDDRRLKDPGGVDYFDELLERIRDIRASEKRFYQKVREVFATTSVDYDKLSDTARAFFATIQNKLIYAVTGRTAAELVVQRCDPAAPNLGLTTWAGDAGPEG